MGSYAPYLVCSLVLSRFVMTYLFRPIHPTLHKNADGSIFQCLETEDNSFWLLHSFKVQYPVYVLISITEEDMEDGAFEDWWRELNYEGRKEYVKGDFYSHHISSSDVNKFLSACCNGLSPEYQLNSFQQNIYKLYLEAKEEQKAQDKDFSEVSKMLAQDLHFEFS